MAALLFLYLVTGLHFFAHTIYFLILYALPMYLVVKGLVKLYRLIENAPTIRPKKFVNRITKVKDTKIYYMYSDSEYAVYEADIDTFLKSIKDCKINLDLSKKR